MVYSYYFGTLGFFSHIGPDASTIMKQSMPFTDEFCKSIFQQAVLFCDGTMISKCILKMVFLWYTYGMLNALP